MTQKNKEVKLITGETFDEAMNRYRKLFDDWNKLTITQRRDKINNFRCGY